MSALEQINRILNVVAVWHILLHPHSSRSFAHVYTTQGDFAVPWCSYDPTPSPLGPHFLIGCLKTEKKALFFFFFFLTKFKLVNYCDKPGFIFIVILCMIFLSFRWEHESFLFHRQRTRQTRTVIAMKTWQSKISNWQNNSSARAL